MKMPPGMPRSRSFTRLTMRVGLPHLGQSVLLVVSMTFLRSAVFAILAPTAIVVSPDESNVCAALRVDCAENGGWNCLDPLWKTLKLRLDALPSTLILQ